MILYRTRKEGKGTHIFWLISSCLHQAVQERWSSHRWFELTVLIGKKPTAPSRGNFFHGTVFESRKSPESLLLHLSRFLTGAHLFAASSGQREKGYVNIRFHHRQTRATCPFSQTRPRQPHFTGQDTTVNTGVSTQLTHSRLSFR